MTLLLKRLWHEQQAQGLSEYVLLLVLVSLTAVTAMGGLASRVNTVYSQASTRMNVATSSASLASGSLGYAAQAPADTQIKSNGKEEQKIGD